MYVYKQSTFTLLLQCNVNVMVNGNIVSRSFGCSICKCVRNTTIGNELKLNNERMCARPANGTDSNSLNTHTYHITSQCWMLVWIGVCVTSYYVTRCARFELNGPLTWTVDQWSHSLCTYTTLEHLWIDITLCNKHLINICFFFYIFIAQPLLKCSVVFNEIYA